MTPIVMKSKVGADGVLQLNVPIGPAEANREMRVTIEPAPPEATSRQEYLDFLQRTAGAWRGDFERPPQGDYEIRDPL